MRRWWSKELAEARAAVAKLARKAYEQGKRGNTEHEIHKEHKALRNLYTQMIKVAKLQHWLEWLESVDPSSIWNVHKFIAAPATDGSSARIPTLKVTGENGEQLEVDDDEGKAKALQKAFFLEPANTGVPRGAEYPEPCTEFRDITETQIHRAIRKLHPYKAAGNDGFANVIFTHCRESLAPVLLKKFRATFTLKYYPPEWKESTTVVLRKPGKADYSVPKAYRPITLLNSIAKILSSVVGEDVAHMVEKYNLLPIHTFGGRAARSCADSLMLNVMWIYDRWRQGKVVSGLFLDISGAFPNTVIPVLVHNMRKRGVPVEITDWITRLNAGHSTVLTFDGYRSEVLQVLSGMDQGNPLSMILFNFYGPDLLKVTLDADELKTAFVDDTMFLAAGEDFEEMNGKLRDMMERAGGENDWAVSHNAAFEVDKFALVHFSRKLERDPTRQRKKRPIGRPALTLGNVTIQPSHSTKFLGVHMDQELRWHTQVNTAVAKGMKYMLAAKRLSKGKRGVPGRLGAQLYTGVVVPKMLYAAEVWCQPILEPRPGRKRMQGSAGFANKMGPVQRMAAIFVTGAMKSTPTVALDAHADFLPVHLLINRICYRAALRWGTLPHEHPMHDLARKAVRRVPKKYPTPLSILYDCFGIKPEEMENIKIMWMDTKWESPMRVHIAGDKKTALKEEEDDNAQVKCYSDGSGYQKGIGAAAVLYRWEGFGKSKVRILRKYLGTEDQQMVYIGELAGELMVLHLLSKETPGRGGLGSVSIYVDNQTSLLALKSTKATSGHFLTDHMHELYRKVVKIHPTVCITFRWIPSHCDVKGNEKADEQAKLAAEGVRNSPMTSLPTVLRKDLPYNKSAMGMAMVKELKKDATRVLQKSKQWARLKDINASMPSTRFRKAVVKMTKGQAVLYIQLRTGHAPLNKHLHRIKATDSPVCSACNNAHETVHHYLLICPATERHRRELAYSLGRDARSVGTLLSHAKAIRPLFKFIGRTGRFKDDFGSMELPEPPDKNRRGKR